MHTVLLFYNYTHLNDPKQEQLRQKKYCQEHNLKGRIIVSPEGINATLEGTREEVTKYQEWLVADPRFSNTHFKTSQGNGHNFPKLSIKVRPELVSGHLGENDVDPSQATAQHITVEELHDWFNQGKEFYIVDMRNDYEHQVGFFQNSVLPSLENFRDLPAILPELEHLKDKTVVTVCTGGVRCEKASGFLLNHGFKDVRQLWGGIHTYMEKYPNQHFLGKLYVFDGRVTMGFNVDSPEHTIVGKCTFCAQPCDTITDCANKHCASSHKIRHFVGCSQCLEQHGGLCQGCIKI